MTKNNKLLIYILVSVVAHAVVIALVVQLKKPEIKPKKKKEVLKSYLVFAQPKKVTPEPPKIESPPVEAETTPVEIETETAQVENLPEQRKAETQAASTPKVAELTRQPEVTEQAKATQTQPNKKEVTITDSQNTGVKTSPYASARSYLEQFNQDQIGKLSQRGFSELTTPRALNSNTGPRTTQDVIDEQSEAFAGKGSGIEVLGEFANKDTMVRLHGTCFRIADDPVTGGQAWLPSNACGSYDKFKGQLQKSIKARLNKHIIPDYKPQNHNPD